MGTSSNGTGPRPTNPLIPNWIPNFPDPVPIPPEELPENPDETPNADLPANDVQDADAPDDIDSALVPNRYSEARKYFGQFRKNAASGNSGSAKLRDSLRGYVAKGGGGSSTFAKRMAPSTSRVAQFHAAINTFKQEGVAAALRKFNIQNYTDKPLLDILAALTDAIFDKSSPYNNIQDDSIAKMAYTNTINRIVETDGIDLNTLTNENIEVMIAIFIEETIATRVLCDIGNSLYTELSDTQQIIDAEETTYQLVSGLVRNSIMPEIISVQRGVVQNIEIRIENIYRIAFDCIAGTIQ